MNRYDMLKETINICKREGIQWKKCPVWKNVDMDRIKHDKVYRDEVASDIMFWTGRNDLFPFKGCSTPEHFAAHDGEWDSMQEEKLNKKRKGNVKINEAQLRKIVAESVKKVLNEVNTLTAYSAEENARRKLKELINNGQGNSAEAAKLRRQIETFESYNEMNDDGVPNKFGRTGADMAQDFMNAGGVKGTGQEYIDADNAYRNNNKQYGGNMTNLHQQMSTQMNQNAYDSANKRMYTPQEMGYTYQAPKKGFMGIGKQKGGWVYNKQQ